MTDISIKVIVADSHLAETEAFCDRLRGMGMRVDRMMPEIGVIFGQGDEALLPRLLATDGVQSAQPEAIFRVPPLPDDVPQ
jgi:hypothetical protein